MVQHFIFSPCQSTTGVNHLIAFKANLLILSHSHSQIEFRHANPSVLSSELSCASIAFELLTLPSLLLIAYASIYFGLPCASIKRKKVKIGDSGIRSLDPRSDKLLCWPQDLDPSIPRSLEWQASMLTARPCHSPAVFKLRCLSNLNFLQPIF